MKTQYSITIWAETTGYVADMANTRDARDFAAALGTTIVPLPWGPMADSQDVRASLADRYPDCIVIHRNETE